MPTGAHGGEVPAWGLLAVLPACSGCSEHGLWAQDLPREGGPRYLSAQGRTQAVVERQDAVGAHHLQRHARHAQLHLLLRLQMHLGGGGGAHRSEQPPGPQLH